MDGAAARASPGAVTAAGAVQTDRWRARACRDPRLRGGGGERRARVTRRTRGCNRPTASTYASWHPMSAAIALESVGKQFGAHAAVENVTLSIAEGEFFSLLGP